MQARGSRFIAFCSLIVALLAMHAGAMAQAYPQRPIRMIVPFAAGGGTDITGRIVAQKLTASLGQTVVVDNRGGAGGVIGADMVAKAAPDGYTLLMAANGPIAVAPGLTKKMPYDSIADFSPVGLVTIYASVVVVHPAVPAKTMKELITYAKANPGKLNFATPGAGSTNHLAVELLKAMAGIDLVHVPYKGTGIAIGDLIGGQVDLMSGDLPALLPHVRTGKLRALGVTSAKRTPLLPEVPTVSEGGVPGFESVGWFAVMAPAGVPKPIITRLNGDLQKIIASEEMREKLSSLGAEPAGSTPEQLGAHVREQVVKWAKVVRAAGLKPE